MDRKKYKENEVKEQSVVLLVLTYCKEIIETFLN